MNRSHEGLQAGVGNFVKEHRTIGKIAPYVFVGTLTFSTLTGCVFGSKNKVPTIDATPTSDKIEQEQKKGYEIIRIADDYYYVGASKHFLDKTYFGKDLVLGLQELKTQFDIVGDPIPLYGVAQPGVSSASVTEGLLIKVSPKQTPKP